MLESSINTYAIIDTKFSVTRMYFIGNLKITFGLGANSQ